MPDSYEHYEEFEQSNIYHRYFEYSGDTDRDELISETINNHNPGEKIYLEFEQDGVYHSTFGMRIDEVYDLFDMMDDEAEMYGGGDITGITVLYSGRM